MVELPVDVAPAIYNGRNDEHEGEPISASILRQDVLNNDSTNFAANYPTEELEPIAKVWDDLLGNLSEGNLDGYSRAFPYQHYKSMFNIVPLTEEDDDIEEKLEEAQITDLTNI